MLFRVRVRDRIVPCETPGEIGKPDCDESDDYQQHNPPLPAPAFGGLICSVGHGNCYQLGVPMESTRSGRLSLRKGEGEGGESFLRRSSNSNQIACRMLSSS